MGADMKVYEGALFFHSTSMYCVQMLWRMKGRPFEDIEYFMVGMYMTPCRKDCTRAISQRNGGGVAVFKESCDGSWVVEAIVEV